MILNTNSHGRSYSAIPYQWKTHQWKVKRFWASDKSFNQQNILIDEHIKQNKYLNGKLSTASQNSLIQALWMYVLPTGQHFSEYT